VWHVKALNTHYNLCSTSALQFIEGPAGELCASLSMARPGQTIKWDLHEGTKDRRTTASKSWGSPQQPIAHTGKGALDSALLACKTKSASVASGSAAVLAL
jgi:hypothetical protein